MRLLVLLLTLPVVLSGCVSPQPEYPVSVMTFDEGLVGTWSSQTSDGSTVLIRFETCDVPVSNGRLSPAALLITGHTEGSAPPAVTAKAYRMVLVTPDGGVSASMLTYLVSIRSGQTLMGVQLADPVGDRPVFGAALPLHYIFKVQRDGDQLRFWSPRLSIAWVPVAHWVDEAPAPGDGTFPPLEQTAPDRNLYITSSIDRVLQIYRRYGATDGFWEPETDQPWRRIKSQ